MLEIGMEIKTPGLLLKVKEVKGKWVRCGYWDKLYGAWRPRGCTENKAKLEAGLKDGRFTLAE